MQWITEIATNKTGFPSIKPPMIYYDRQFLYHSTMSDGCRYKCIFVNTTQNLSRGDATVFSKQFPVHESIILKKRGVLVAFETGESPLHAPILLPAHLNQIELVITYMAKSPVPYIYSIFVRNRNPRYGFTAEEAALMLSKNYVYLLPPHHRSRRKMIAWVVSNHYAKNNRAEYASAIAKFIPVDIYGRKGLKFPPNVKTFHFLSLNYKFYLSFENSNCRNYITEKVYFNAMQHDMIPIVLGAFKADYESALPPHSYINVDDYKSVRELTDYLLHLDGNDTAYAAYFAWKEYGKFLSPNRLDCRLCGFMHRLNAGCVRLPKQNAAELLDPRTLCFDRPLPPLE
ncbi:glycoprotein 3 alpha L fucosyltransferase [Echinococcus multilocularis]|uniref:Fucosyltransferase n=1 Tax=Echinococcus multilocularis TaxID=6211 RepID=A0A068XX33_ECHMU|nr:glycoprotein 3 alpha L fucosyltransferase [Echinococcus multilocularis]